MTDKKVEKEIEKEIEKKFESVICNIIDINREQNIEIDRLKNLNCFYREIIERQFLVLCDYASIFRNDEDNKQHHTFKDLRKVFEDYGLEKLSSEVLSEIQLMGLRRR